MKITVLSRLDLHTLMTKHESNAEELFWPFAYVVSMSRSDQLPLFPEEHFGLLRMTFDDIEFKDYTKELRKAGRILFNREHAKEIIDFLRNVCVDRNRTLICQCSAGVSRSGAVGRFANELFDRDSLDYKGFYENNPHIFPNGYIYNLLMEVSGLVR